ncbi:MAG: SDR family NAD(P)-dependent oxidoreductase, partial [Candidatus Omnitrophica bacterium]|nr:SDR family NAD(P)-dependent oxidoreductase [Candidatus Omnitrophota bacterium]
MNIKNKKVLVTGSEGFIGSHLVETLVSAGCDVRAFVLYNSFNSWGWLDSFDKTILKKIEIFTGDIRDPNGVRAAMKDVDVVFHLAALIGIPFSYNSPDCYVDTNVKGTLNILQAAMAQNVEKILVTSTSEVYGTAKYAPIDEAHPLQGQSPYSATKIAADKISESFFRSFGLPVTIVRPFNTYGP